MRRPGEGQLHAFLACGTGGYHLNLTQLVT
jgi:hypothetical protein